VQRDFATESHKEAVRSTLVGTVSALVLIAFVCIAAGGIALFFFFRR
jgi:hypothetical protein